jgi:hypothetical protein
MTTIAKKSDNMSYGRGLKYQVDELARDPWNRQENDPPYCPNVRASRDVDPYVPDIAGMITNFIEAGINTNAIRRMTFNIVSENGYKNQEFEKLVDVAILGVESALIENSRAHPLDVARTVTEELVNMYAGTIANAFPELEHGQGVGSSVYDRAVDYGKELVQVVRECKETIERASRGANNRDYDRRDGGRGRDYRGDSRGGNGSAYTRTTFDLSNGNRTDTRRDNNRSDPFAACRAGRSGSDNRSQQPAYTRDQSYPTTTRGSKVEEISKSPVQETKEEQETGPTYKDWVRTNNQPYLRAFPVTTHYQMFTKRGDKLQQVVTVIGDDMDSKQHSIPYPSYMTSMAWKGNQEAVDAAMNRLQASLLAGKKSADPFKGCDAHIEQKAIVSTDGSLRGSITAAKLNRAAMLTERPSLQVYGTGTLIRFQMLQNELPEETHELDANKLSRLGQKSTFVEVRDQLIGLSTGFKRLHLNRLNKLLTGAVNTVLHHNLSLPTYWRMDNFFDDIDKIEEFMLEDFGQLPVEAWQQNQADVISELFYQQTDFEEDDTTAPFSYFDHHYNLLLLTLTSGELGVEIPEGVSVRLDESLSPALHDLVKTQIQDLGGESGLCTYIITNDGLVLAATRGWLAEDCFLVRVVENVYM